MPYEQSTSPVTPSPNSRLWTAGASGGIAVLVMLGLAVAYHEVAAPLVVGAIIAGVATWLVNRPAVLTVGEAEPAASEPDIGLSGFLLDNVFEALDDPVLIISGGEADDIAGRRIIAANASAREVLRLQHDGSLLVSVIRDPGILEAVDEALFGGMFREENYVTTGAQDRHWRVWTRPLPEQKGQALALLGMRDETDVRRMEMMRVDFLANASHELRTPLASLSGFIETLKGHAKDDPKARDRFLDIMAVQADRMGRLVADLLSLSRIELNEHVPPSGRVDLRRAASDVADAVSLLAAERGVQLKLFNDGGPARVTGDRDEIVQVIQNLVDNALKYSSSGGHVEVTIRAGLTLDEASAPGLTGATRLSLVTPDREARIRYATVVVRDHGPGMAREYLPRLTERFYRVEGQKSGDRTGTGLGLAIVKHIVNRHRGGLAVESALGQGAAFTAFFPLAPDRITADAGPEIGQ